MSARALSWGLMALLLLATLGEGGASPQGVLAVHSALAALVLLALLVPRLSGERRAPAFPAGLAFAAFALLALAGACIAPYRYAAFLVLQEIAAFAGAAFLATRCGPGLAARAGGPLLVGAALEGTFALVQRFGGELRPAGTFLNPNHLAAWMVAALLAGAGIVVASARPAARWTGAAVAAPAALTLALGASRGALAALVAGALALLLLSWRRIGPRTRVALASALVLLVVTAAAGVVLRFERGDAYRYHRLMIWEASLKACAVSPWTGTGPGQFAAAAANLNFPIAGGPLRYARSFQTTHSDVLRLPAEFGLPATLAILVGLALAVEEITRRWRRFALPREAAGAIAALVALAVQASFDNLSQRPGIHLLIAVLLGSLLSTEVPGPARGRGRALRVTAAAAVAVLVVVGDFAPYLAWRSVHGLPRGRLDATGRGRLSAALAWNPLHPDLWLRRAEDLESGPAWSASVYAEAREAAERAVRLDPADARYRMGVARLEALACTSLFRDEATRARASARYDEASERSLHDPFPFLEKGGFLLDTGDPAGARRAAEQALRIEPEAVPARLLLAEAVLAEGLAGARRRADQLVSEAEASARRWAAPPEGSPYERNLLILDVSRARAIRSRRSPD
jgi:O-antigen ligase